MQIHGNFEECPLYIAVHCLGWCPIMAPASPWFFDLLFDLKNLE